MGSLKKEGEMEQMGDETMEAILYVNGVRSVLPDGLGHMTLLEYLRGVYITCTSHDSYFFDLWFPVKF